MKRSSHSRARLAALGLVAFGSGPLARAQVFDYDLVGSGAQGSFGLAASTLGDLDGDGCEDFVVGEPTSDIGLFSTLGAVYVVSGKYGAWIEYFAGNPDADFGYAVDGKIDADGDGYPDLIVGAPLDSVGANLGGGFYVVSPHLGTTLYNEFLTIPNGYLGTSVRSLQGDLDGDGTIDFITGAPGAGTVFVFSGAGSGFIYQLIGQSGSLFGQSVSRAGNLDGDRHVDFVIGSPNFVDAGGQTTGRVTAYAGKDGSVLWTTDGAANSSFGSALAAPGDLDGDGFDDIVAGAPLHLNPGGLVAGCATVLSGQSGSALYKVFGDDTGDTFGQSVRAVGGDIDADGTVDFIVGAPQLSGSEIGYARTVSGATGDVLFTYLGHTNNPFVNSHYGSAVAGGDFNGDGETDVLVGGSNFDGGDGIAETWITAVASWQNYGSGWAGTLGVPTIAPTTNPIVGQNLQVDISNSAGVTTPGILLLGFSKATIPTGKGGTLLVDPLLYIPASIPPGGLTLNGSVPNDPSLYGFNLYLQGLELDAGASKGLSFTLGLDLYFGFP